MSHGEGMKVAAEIPHLQFKIPSSSKAKLRHFVVHRLPMLAALIALGVFLVVALAQAYE